MTKHKSQTLDDLARARIIAWRKAAALTQKELGQRCGRNVVWVNRWEKGRYNADLDTLSRLAGAFNHTLFEALDVATAGPEQRLVEGYRAIPSVKGRAAVMTLIESIGHQASAVGDRPPARPARRRAKPNGLTGASKPGQRVTRR